MSIGFCSCCSLKSHAEGVSLSTQPFRPAFLPIPQRLGRRIAIVFLPLLSAFPLSAQESTSKLEKSPTAGLLATYPKRVPKYIGDRVMTVFEHPRQDGPVHRAVAAAMRHDALALELMTTDAAILHGPTFSAVLQRRERILATVDQLLAIPEKDIDIWSVAMTLAQDAYPDLDKTKLNREFESFVSRAGALAKARDDPDFHVRALNTFIYKKWGIAYDTSDYMGRKLINRYPHGVLTTRKGSCANLATFYISVAQRLGFPVYAVAAPQHYFARYVDPRLFFQNIEPTGRGGYSPDAQYVRDMEISPLAIEKGTFLRTMTHQELVADMIADHAGHYAVELKDYPTAIAILDRALARYPRAADYWYFMGQIYKFWGFQEVMREVREIKFTRAFVFMQKALRMGKGKPLEEGYWKELQKKPAKRGPGV